MVAAVQQDNEGGGIFFESPEAEKAFLEENDRIVGEATVKPLADYTTEQLVEYAEGQAEVGIEYLVRAGQLLRRAGVEFPYQLDPSGPVDLIPVTVEKVTERENGDEGGDTYTF